MKIRMNNEEMGAFENGRPKDTRYGGLIKHAYVLNGGWKNSKTWARKKARNYNSNFDGEGDRKFLWIFGIVRMRNINPKMTSKVEMHVGSCNGCDNGAV